MKKQFIFLILLGFSLISFAQSELHNAGKQNPMQNPEANKSSDAEKKIIEKVGNPWNSSSSLNLHNYYSPKIQGTTEVGNIMLLRALVSTKRHMIRTTLPFVSTPTKDGYKSGIGNLNIFDAIRITGDSANTHFGVGPLVSIPTATKAVAGIGKWQLGAVALAIHADKAGALVGALVTYRHSVEGKNEISNIYSGGHLAIQPILLLNMGNGLYGRSFGTTCIVDFKSKNTLIPIGIGIGKFFKVGNTVVNMFVEPGYTIYSEGKNIPAYQILIGMDFLWFNGIK